jgi:hypothetical protein
MAAGEPVSLREDALSPVTAKLGAAARAVIAAEVERSWADLLEGIESAAGLLLGRVTGDSVTITAATGPGRDARPGVGRMSFVEEEALAGAPLGDVVGSWHAHDSGRPFPGERDLADWGAALARSGLLAEVGLLVTSADGWVISHLHPWVVRQDHGRLVCEAASITE